MEAAHENDKVSMMRADLADFKGASNLAFNNKIKSLRQQGLQIYHLGFGESPFPVPPVFAESLKKNAGRHEYFPVAGTVELREKVLQFHRRYDDFHHFDINSVITGPGSKELIFLILDVFGGEVLLVSPSWESYYPQCKLAGRKVHILPTSYENRFLVTPDFLDTFVTENCCKTNYKILVLNYPNNPTGLSPPSEWLSSITEICRKHNILVVSDEIYGRLHYEGAHESIAKFYPEGTIVCTGFSKWASAGGWRAGYALFPQELRQLYKAVGSAGSNTFTCCPAPVQYALCEGLDYQDELHDYVLHIRRILKAVGHYAHRKLHGAGAKCIPPEGAYYFMPDFEIMRKSFETKGIFTGQQMCDDLLKNANVAMLPAGPFNLRPIEELTGHLCFVNFDGQETLKQSRSLGLQQEIHVDEQFVHKYCSPTVNGIEEILRWMHRNM